MDKLISDPVRWVQQPSDFRLRSNQDFAKTLEQEQQRDPGRSHVPSKPTVSAGDAMVAAHVTAPAKGGNCETYLRAKDQSSVGAYASVPISRGARANADPGVVPNAGFAQDQKRTLALGLLPGQLTWSRIFPEHLIAGGYLSVLETATGCVQGVSGQLGGRVLATDIDDVAMVGSAGSDRSNPIAKCADETTATNLATLSLACSEVIKPLAGEASWALPAHMTIAAELADQLWAERLVRLTRDGDGRETVWLRDFRLGEVDLGTAAAALKQAVQQGGAHVDRVVINGREVWRASVSEGGRAHVG